MGRRAWHLSWLPHRVIPGRRGSGEPEIFFNSAGFRINAPKARLHASLTRYGVVRNDRKRREIPDRRSVPTPRSINCETAAAETQKAPSFLTGLGDVRFSTSVKRS